MSEASDLLELQAVDLEIIRATKRLDELPEKRAILETRAKMRDAQALQQKAGMLVRKLESEVKARQDEVTTLKEKISSEQTKVMNTTDHRAVQSITREMDGLKRRVDKVEMEELQYMERVEKARGQVAQIDEHLAKLQAHEAQLIERFKSVGGDVQAEIDRQTKLRTKLAKRVDPTILKKYEEVRDSRGGIGVGRLEGTMCSACRMNLPAEKVKALQAGADIMQCPQCRRLIVTVEVEQ